MIVDPTSKTLGDLEDFPWPTHVPWYSLRAGNSTDCDYWKNTSHLLFITVMVTAASVVVLLNVMQWWHCRAFNWNIIVPVNLLSSTPFRMIYCLILSCWGADLLQNILDWDLYYHSSHPLLNSVYLYALTPAVLILRQSVAYFPVFACVDPPVPLVGHAIGLFYTLLLGASSIYSEATMLHGCSHRGRLSNKDIGISLGTVVPIYLFYLVIALWFFWHTAIEAALVIFTEYKWSRNIRDHDVDGDHIKHVKSLLQIQMKQTGPIHTDKLWHHFIHGLKYVIFYRSHFKYPLPFLGAMCMSYTVIYQLAVHLSAYQIIHMEKALDFLQSFNITVKAIETLLPNTAPKLNRLFDAILTWARAYRVILPLGTTGGAVLCLLLTLYMIQTFHKRLHSLAKGDFSSLVASEPLPSLSYRLAAAMRYSAFQVAYLIFSWIQYTLIGWVLMSVGLFFYYGFNYFQYQAVHIFALFMVPMMWGAALHLVQVVLCKIVFLDKNNRSSMVIQYRQFYQLLSYLFFFFNVIYGMVMCMLRSFGVFIFTTLMLFRLDWDVFMRGLEGWDTGFRTFVGYMYLEHSHNNSVLRVFLWLAVRGSQREKSGQTSLLANGNIQSSVFSKDGNTYRNTDVTNQRTANRSSRALKRWLVAYTLLRNPSLQGLTASRLQERIHCN